MESSFFLIATCYFLVAIIVPRDEERTRLTMLWERGAVAAAVLSLILFPFGLMQQTYFGSEVAWLPGHTLVSTREGLVETVRYYRRDVHGEPKYYRLVTNGHSMSATSTASKRYMKLYVYIPIAIKPDTRDALLISYGVGQTAKALTDSKGLRKIDIVDISEDILEMSDIVFPGNENPLRDDRVRVHVEDGRFFLNTTGNRYDLITSEPPPPKIAGVVNLYSQEYFELIRERLNPGGYASYWLPVKQLEPIEALAITRAFCNAFDDCSLWSGAGLEWMLLGSNGADRPAAAEQFAAQWYDPQVAAELIGLGLEKPAQLGSLFMADTEQLMAMTADVAPVTDNYPSRISSRPVGQQGYIELYARLMDEAARLERFRQSAQVRKLLPAEIRKDSEKFFQYERLIKNHFTAGVYLNHADPYLWEAIDGLLTDTTLTTLPLWLLGSDRENQDIVAALLERHGYRDEFALELARKYVTERDYETALRYVDIHIAKAGDVSDWASRFYLYLLAKNGMAERAASIIANLQSLGRPGLDRFLDWYRSRFDVSIADGLETAGPGVAPETDSVD